jgi:uncharacterized protein (DUF1697 family)
MPKYVALLRGIMPTNPNMRNEKLRGIFEKLGFNNVRTVIASGNVLFETSAKKGLEESIEKALARELGLSCATIIRSYNEIRALVGRNPFKGMTESASIGLNVTFLKDRKSAEGEHRAPGRGFVILGAYDGTVCSRIDRTKDKTPELMRWLEKEFGRGITTRTWKTVGKILKALDDK